MELIHNGRAERIESARLARVGDVLAACTESVDHVLLSLRLDGCEIDETERAEIEHLSTDVEGRLEVESRPRRAVARDGLESAAAYASEVAGAFERAAGLLREGHFDRAQVLLATCLDAVVVLLSAVRRAADALGAVAEPLAACEPELERGLAAMETCFAATDWVGLADCVEFEVSVAIGKWPERIGAVRLAAGDEQ